MHFTFCITLLIVVGAVYCAPPKATDIEGESKADPKPLNVTDENVEDVRLPNTPADSVPGDDEGYESDYADAVRQLVYWYAHYYDGSSPHVRTMTDSSIAWINRLNPKFRDQSLRNAYIVRVGDSFKPKRMESIVTSDPYEYVHRLPYARRPVSYIVDGVIATYDDSCSPRHYPFIKAPRLSNMQVARYDHRQNPKSPHNYYLTAVYRCKDGYEMRDSRFTELNCRRRDWVGARPVCDRRG